MRRTLLVALLALAAGAPPALAQDARTDASIADGSAQRALDRARAEWKAAAVRSYRFEVRTSCFCPPAEPERFVVRGGRASSTSPLATIPRLHRVVQRAIDDRVERLFVRFGKLGIPRSIGIDRSTSIADEEVSYGVTGFRR